ncbi:hypothetical protein [Flavobacterium sp. N1861]|uniref:hypothetical protein n=1 Tax=Flavobacterium sp. N1861 TaxID=2986825 RepID=UPI00222436E7|nr:hypothetical protein [Flavobacterium sp. N1861]
MNEEYNELAEKNKEDLPLVLFDLESKTKDKKVTSKLIKIKKYKTNLYQKSLYIKHVTRFI